MRVEGFQLPFRGMLAGGVQMPLTDYHAKYFAYELTKRCSSDGLEKLAGAFADALVDLNPHQVEAALFAFKSPLSRGALLADEVGLGKTAEAGLVVAQKWAERKRRILVITPASLRKQWLQELQEKFFLPCAILETRSYNEAVRRGSTRPFEPSDQIVICSYQFARSEAADVQTTHWNLATVDEAHHLRNVYKPPNGIANTLKRALGDAPKLLLTATPLQNSLLELFGLVSLIDEHAFGDLQSFREQFAYLNNRAVFETLKARLQPICKRTLRLQVTAYVSYTRCHPTVQPFTPQESEDRLYNLVSEYLRRENLQALPSSQRSLMTLVLRKLLASSSFAVAGALETMNRRLRARLARQQPAGALDEEPEEDYEALDETAEEWPDATAQVGPPSAAGHAAIEPEIADLERIKQNFARVSQSQLAAGPGFQPQGAPASTLVAPSGQPSASHTPEGQRIAQIAHAAVRKPEGQPRTLASSTHLQGPEARAQGQQGIAAHHRPAPPAPKGAVPAPSVAATAAKTPDLVFRRPIDTRRILVASRSESRRGSHPSQWPQARFAIRLPRMSSGASTPSPPEQRQWRWGTVVSRRLGSGTIWPAVWCMSITLPTRIAPASCTTRQHRWSPTSGDALQRTTRAGCRVATEGRWSNSCTRRCRRASGGMLLAATSWPARASPGPSPAPTPPQSQSRRSTSGSRRRTRATWRDIRSGDSRAALSPPGSSSPTPSGASPSSRGQGRPNGSSRPEATSRSTAHPGLITCSTSGASSWRPLIAPSRWRLRRAMGRTRGTHWPSAAPDFSGRGTRVAAPPHAPASRGKMPPLSMMSPRRACLSAVRPPRTAARCSDPLVDAVRANEGNQTSRGYRPTGCARHRQMHWREEDARTTALGS